MAYQVDLKAYMACCEANYHQLLRLFPALRTAQRRRLGLALGQHSEVLLTVLEQTSYTNLLSIEQGPLDRGDDELRPAPDVVDERPSNYRLYTPTLVVRMYHDAQVAEVISCDKSRGVRPKNSYPNQQMFQPDEKRQWNDFLGDWLAQCREHGYSLDDDVLIKDAVCEE